MDELLSSSFFFVLLNKRVSWFDSITEYDPEYAGDVNADTDVNVTDVTSLINHILGNASFEAKRCDVNEDSKVDVSDVTSLINLLLY